MLLTIVFDDFNPRTKNRMSEKVEITVNTEGMGDEIVKAVHASKSYVASAFLTLLLYYVGFFIIGLICNIVFLSQSNESKRIVGANPSGRWLLSIPTLGTHCTTHNSNHHIHGEWSICGSEWLLIMLRKSCIFFIRAYQFIWHPIYRGAEDRGVTLVHCNLRPTCSEYAIQVFKTHSFIHAFKLSWERLLLCHQLEEAQETKIGDSER
jgi:putative component of membrane protein insertase Oxa1/YidC/SpoIIIJ protein YidD